jgi:hypothetical protein
MIDPDTLGFLTTMGREFCLVLESEAGISGASGQDCYSAVADALDTPLTSGVLRSLGPEQFAHLANALNVYFEATTITPGHVARAVSATLRHWS